MNRLEHLLGIFVIAAAIATGVCLLSNGCSTTPTTQTTVYNSLESVETTADGLYSNYVAGVIAGTYSTNNLPAISKAYNDLHAAVAVANSLNQGTNGIVPTTVVTDLTNLVSLITQH